VNRADLLGSPIPPPSSSSAAARSNATPVRSNSSQKRAPSSFVPPADFAKSVAKGLGLEGEQAEAAIAVIDRVMMISEEQLQKLDAATRAQIMQVRKDLGIDKALAARSTSTSIPPPRSASAPRLRSTQQQPQPSAVPSKFAPPPSPSLSSVPPLSPLTPGTYKTRRSTANTSSAGKGFSQIDDDDW